jgi:hypothetical protein
VDNWECEGCKKRAPEDRPDNPVEDEEDKDEDPPPVAAGPRRSTRPAAVAANKAIVATLAAAAGNNGQAKRGRKASGKAASKEKAHNGNEEGIIMDNSSGVDSGLDNDEDDQVHPIEISDTDGYVASTSNATQSNNDSRSSSHAESSCRSTFSDEIDKNHDGAEGKSPDSPTEPGPSVNPEEKSSSDSDHLYHVRQEARARKIAPCIDETYEEKDLAKMRDRIAPLPKIRPHALGRLHQSRIAGSMIVKMAFAHKLKVLADMDRQAAETLEKSGVGVEEGVSSREVKVTPATTSLARQKRKRDGQILKPTQLARTESMTASKPVPKPDLSLQIVLDEVEDGGMGMREIGMNGTRTGATQVGTPII